MRGGSLGRDKPDLLFIETPKYTLRARVRPRRRSTGEEARQWPRHDRREEYPGGLKTHERTGSGRAANTAGRTNGLLVEPKPLKGRSLHKRCYLSPLPSRREELR